MTAAAGAGRAAMHLAGAGTTGGRVAAVGAVVAAGLVEGVALGSAQAAVLARLLPRFRRRRYLLVTVLAAGLGWAGGSLPEVLTDDVNAAPPPVALVVLGGAGIGLVAGTVLGVAQAFGVRGAVTDPGRWVLANVLAWPGAMALIFAGAGLPAEGWPVWAVLATGAVSGVTAGAALGAVTGRFLPGRRAGMHVTPLLLTRTMGEQLKRG